MSAASVVVEGVTARVSLRALDRCIGELVSARRRFSLLHDLGHHILAEPGANQSGMSVIFDCLTVLSKAEHDHLADLPAGLSLTRSSAAHPATQRRGAQPPAHRARTGRGRNPHPNGPGQVGQDARLAHTRHAVHARTRQLMVQVSRLADRHSDQPSLAVKYIYVSINQNSGIGLFAN